MTGENGTFTVADCTNCCTTIAVSGVVVDMPAGVGVGCASRYATRCWRACRRCTLRSETNRLSPKTEQTPDPSKYHKSFYCRCLNKATAPNHRLQLYVKRALSVNIQFACSLRPLFCFYRQNKLLRVFHVAVKAALFAFIRYAFPKKNIPEH